MARLVFDARSVAPRMHGIGRHAYHLARELIGQGRHEVVLLRMGDYLVDHWPATRSVDVGCKLYGLRELYVVPRALARLGADLFVSPSYFAPPLGACPQVMTVHDLTHLWRPMRTARHVAYYDAVVGPAARRSRRVFTETRHAARAIVRRLRVRPERVVVVPSGAGLSAHAPPAATRDVVLCVTNDKPHKNAAGALAAFAHLVRARPSERLVLVGAVPPGLERIAAGLRGVEWRPRVEEDELAALYARAKGFLFPSFSEGFGYPPLEAMDAGAPVVASSASCIPEVLGDAAVYADPRDPAAMAQAMARVLGDSTLAAELVRRGRERLARYSWAEMGARIGEEIDRVLAEGSIR